MAGYRERVRSDREQGRSDPRLVYVEKRENLAYFSADPDISGDDWDDYPWELNAEPPSEWDARVVWVGWGLERTEGSSVDRINAGAAPWLTSSYGEETVYIHAGDSVEEFIAKVEAAGSIAMIVPERPVGQDASTGPVRREPLEVQALFPPDADGAVELMWPAMRAGHKVKRTLYLQRGRNPADGDELVGIVDTGELAAEVVARWNRGLDGRELKED